MAGLLSLPPTIGKPLPTAPDRHAHSHRHKLKQVNRSGWIAATAALVLTLGVVGVGVANAGLASRTVPAHALSDKITTIDMSRAAVARNRIQPVSRSADRMAQLARKGKSKLHRLTRYATTDLKLRTEPREKAKVLTVVESGTKLVATGITAGDYAQVLTRTDDYRWVTAEYLAKHKPDPTPTPTAESSPEPASATESDSRSDSGPVGIAGGPCPDGSVENGLTAGAIRVYRAVCHAFPEITSYGGWDAHGEHASGKAIDIMTSDVALGTRIAEYLRSNAAALDLYDVIWRQHIFTQERGSEGWRWMPDRGSATANHYDHVHVSVN
jgi:hypothetical protein